MQFCGFGYTLIILIRWCRKPILNKAVGFDVNSIKAQYETLGPMAYEEKVVSQPFINNHAQRILDIYRYQFCHSY